jgi:hypothetical protein
MIAELQIKALTMMHALTKAYEKMALVQVGAQLGSFFLLRCD